MSSALHVDDGGKVVSDPQAMRPTAGASNVLTGTMSAATQTFTLPTSATSGTGGSSLFQMTGTQPILFAVDKSGQAASYTSASNMCYVPANWVYYFKAGPADTTIYILQGGTAGSFFLNAIT